MIMSENKNKIPVNTMDDNFSKGISIDKNNIKKSDLKTPQQLEESAQSHRDEGYTFHILEKGEVVIEIDFQTYHVYAPAVVYLHPSQVHRILDFENVVVCSLSIDSENLNPVYLKILEEITPAIPLSLAETDIKTVSDSFALCLSFYKQKNIKLYKPLLRDISNAMVALLLSHFLDKNKPEEYFSRFDKVAKSFRKLLEKNHVTLKRPGEYAELLNISTPYLNECVKNATGFSVSQLIHERVILEAKRLLYHTDKSVKEIAFELGYADYPYFTRLFRKVTGVSALVFKSKNYE